MIVYSSIIIHARCSLCAFLQNTSIFYTGTPQLYTQLFQNIEELEKVNKLERSFIHRNYVLKLWVIHKLTGENLFYLGQNYAKDKMKSDH